MLRVDGVCVAGAIVLNSSRRPFQCRVMVIEGIETGRIKRVSRAIIGRGGTCRVIDPWWLPSERACLTTCPGSTGSCDP